MSLNLTAAVAVASTAGEMLAFEFGGDTFVFTENGTQDVVVNMVGVTGATEPKPLRSRGLFAVGRLVRSAANQ
jgi:hypothetical protein